MKYFTCVFSLVAFTFVVGCGDSSIKEPCDQFAQGAFVLDIQDEFVTPPGIVSVFFKADTRAGTPIAGLTKDNFRIYEMGRNDDCFKEISAFESNADLSTNAQVYGSHTMLVLDLSGSVIHESLDELKQAAVSFIEQIMPDLQDDAFKMGIYWFDGSDELHELSDFVSDRNVLMDIVSGLNADLPTDPSTDLYGAVIKATNISTVLINNLIANGIIATTSIVLFTDGTDQAARHTKADAIQTVNNANSNISFFTIGLGDEIDKNVLQEIGKTSTIIAEDKAALEAKFIETSALVYDQANSYYIFEYCSPKRDGSGINQLAIQLNHLGQTGAVMTSFDATGFSGGCD